MDVGIVERQAIQGIADVLKMNRPYPSTVKVEDMREAVQEAINAESQAAGDDYWNQGYYVGLEEGVAQGIEEGKAIGRFEGIAEGRNAEWSDFWDSFQDFGNRTDYQNAFKGFGFNFNNFYPKYDIKPKANASMLFYAWENTATQKGNLTQRLKYCGVILDTSQVTVLSHLFNYGRFTEIPEIDCTGLLLNSPSQSLFSNSWGALERIDNIKVKEGLTFTGWFNNTNLAYVRFEGVISEPINLQWSTRLDHDSLMSIINVLKDYSGTDTWKEIILGSGNIAKLSATELEIMDKKQWNYR